MAVEAGGSRVANMVAMGAYLGRTSLLNHGGVLHMLEGMTKNKAQLEVNLRAFEAGVQFAKN